MNDNIDTEFKSDMDKESIAAFSHYISKLDQLNKDLSFNAVFKDGINIAKTRILTAILSSWNHILRVCQTAGM